MVFSLYISGSVKSGSPPAPSSTTLQPFILPFSVSLLAEPTGEYFGHVAAIVLSQMPGLPSSALSAPLWVIFCHLILSRCSTPLHVSLPLLAVSLISEEDTSTIIHGLVACPLLCHPLLFLSILDSLLKGTGGWSAGNLSVRWQRKDEGICDVDIWLFFFFLV